MNLFLKNLEATQSHLETSATSNLKIEIVLQNSIDRSISAEINFIFKVKFLKFFLYLNNFIQLNKIKEYFRYP